MLILVDRRNSRQENEKSGSLRGGNSVVEIKVREGARIWKLTSVGISIDRDWKSTRDMFNPWRKREIIDRFYV